MLQKIGGGFDPDYQAVLDFATANAISKPNSFTQIGQNALMIELKGYGLLSRFDFFFCFIDNTTTSTDFKKICWKRLISGNDLTLPLYDEYGIEGDFDPLFLLNSGTNYTVDDACYGHIVYQLNTLYLNSIVNSTNTSFRIDNNQKRINSGSNLSASVNLSGQNGLMAISRYDSSNVSVFHKSTEYARTQASGVLSSNYFLINHYNGGAQNNIISCSFNADAFSGTDYANLRSAFNNYLTYLGLSAFA